jgi:hypothetical protein
MSVPGGLNRSTGFDLLAERPFVGKLASSGDQYVSRPEPQLAAQAMLSTLVRGVGNFDCGEQSGLNRLAEDAYSENGDNRNMRLRC